MQKNIFRKQKSNKNLAHFHSHLYKSFLKLFFTGQKKSCCIITTGSKYLKKIIYLEQAQFQAF
jgi:hypothetical protein